MPGERVEGTITSVTAEGSLVTDITADRLRNAPRGQQTIIECDDHETRGIFTFEHNEPPFTLLALLNADQCLELTIVGDSARDMLGLRPGMKVLVRW